MNSIVLKHSFDKDNNNGTQGIDINFYYWFNYYFNCIDYVILFIIIDNFYKYKLMQNLF
jgi:hypothetical protein